jgi:hypothetical protein
MPQSSWDKTWDNRYPQNVSALPGTAAGRVFSSSNVSTLVKVYPRRQGPFKSRVTRFLGTYPLVSLVLGHPFQWFIVGVPIDIHHPPNLVNRASKHQETDW